MTPIYPARKDADGVYVRVMVTHIVRATDGPWLAPDHCMLSFSMIVDDRDTSNHTLKTLEPWFSEVVAGRKTAELRSEADRIFKVGDVIRLQLFQPV